MTSQDQSFCVGDYIFTHDVSPQYDTYRCNVPGGYLWLIRETGMRTYQGKFIDHGERWHNRLYTPGRYKTPARAALAIIKVWEAAA